MSSFQFIVLFAALSFGFYGTSCILSDHMKSEFRRYNLANFRLLTGVLELVGAIGLLIGLFQPGIGAFAATGLAVLMLLGVFVRNRIGDNLLQSFPALLYLILNGYLSITFALRSFQA